MAIVNISNAIKTAFVTALNTALGNNAIISFYSGLIPTGPDATISGGNTLLSRLTFSPTNGFGTVTGSVLIANGMPLQAVVIATGTVTWARLTNSTSIAVVDVDVGLSETTITVANTQVISGNFLQIIGAVFQAN